MTVVACKDVARDEHDQWYGKQRDNIQQHFRNCYPGTLLRTVKIPGGMHEHDA